MTGFAQMLTNDGYQLTPYQRLLADDGPEPAFRYLIARAQAGKTVTYKEMAEHIGKELKLDKTNDWHHMGLVVGSLIYNVQRICGMKIPPINILLVRGGSKLPGVGANPFVDNYLGGGLRVENLDGPSHKALMHRLLRDIYDYDEWDVVYEKVFGKKLPAELKRKAPQKKKTPKGGRGGFGGEAESAEHKALKEAVYNNPKQITGRNVVCWKDMEYRFPSADEVDVYVDCNRVIYCIEVKPNFADEKELERGLYQCVKYKALAEAEQKDKLSKHERRPVRSVLAYAVPRGITPELKRKARAFSVELQYWRQPKP